MDKLTAAGIVLIVLGIILSLIVYITPVYGPGLTDLAAAARAMSLILILLFYLGIFIIVIGVILILYSRYKRKA